MSEQRPPQDADGETLARRAFLVGGATAVAGAWAGCGGHAPPRKPVTGPTSLPATRPAGARIRRYRTLGRTGFAASDIALGGGQLAEPNVVRYAFDHGINLFDTAETYGNGDSERAIGAAMRHLPRDKIFVVTKLKLAADESERSILQRFARSLQRLQTRYVDALYMHGVRDATMVKHPAFHKAVARLKAAGKVKHAGISSHGPRGKGDAMDRVLLAAAADGRFDVMLLVYNFINHAPGDKVLAACAKRNIGATLMKVAPGRLKLQPLDPQRLTAGQERRVAIWVGRGMTRAQALAKLARRLKRAEARAKKNRPLLAAFVAKHGIETEEQLARRSVQWALRHPGAQSACVSIADFAGVDSILPASGAALSRHDAELLRDVAALYHGEHCRHGCNACAASCPRDVPVSTVMRYAYYFELQRREKLAIGKYARLAVDAAACADCPGWCEAACPHGLAVQAQLLAAHDRLTLA